MIISVCGHIELVDLLESEGASLSSPDTHKAFPLHYAAQMCGTTGEGADPKMGLKMLNKLLSKKCHVDCADQDLRTPLLWAASSGQDAPHTKNNIKMYPRCIVTLSNPSEDDVYVSLEFISVL